MLALHVRNEIVNRTGAPLPDLQVGAAGVDLFFAISGFVMVYSSQPLFEAPMAAAFFIMRRIIRVVPLYWLCTVMTALIFVVLKWRGAIAELTPGNILDSLLFIPYARSDGVPLPILELGWTLNYEMMFYVVFAFALMLPIVSAVFAMTALFCAMVCVGSLIALPLPLSFWCDPIILEFCFGMLIALAFRAGWRLSRRMSLVLLLAACASLWSVYVLDVPRPVFRGLPAAAIFVAIVLRPLTDERAGVATRTMALLGDASYSLYLSHLPVILVIASIVSYFHLDPSRWVYLYGATVTAAALAASMLLYVMFERPVTRVLRRRLSVMMLRLDGQIVRQTIAST